MTDTEFDAFVKEARSHHHDFPALESEHEHGYETDLEGQDVHHEALATNRYEDPLW